MSTAAQRHRLRIKFVWGGAELIRGHWFLGLFCRYDRVEGRREDGLAVSVRGLVAWLAGLGLVLYLAGATLLYSLWDRNPYNLLSFGDALLYPVRRAALQPKKGQAFINQGLDLWRQGKPHDAARLLRLGLERVPRDLKARTILAQYYLRMNNRPLAQKTVEDGLANEYPGRAYLAALFEIAEEGEDYARIVQTCERYRKTLAGDAGLRDQRWLEAKQFAALMAMNRPAEALALVAEQAGWSDLAAEQRVLALLALGRTGEAVQLLADWHARPGADLRLVTRLQVRALREAKQLDAMDRALEELRRLTPNQPQPIVYAVVQRAMAGRTAEARATLDDYLFRMAKTPAEVQLVAEPLEEIANLPLLERCAEAAAERGYPKESCQVLLVQVHVRRGEWLAAQQILRQMAPADPKAAPRAAAFSRFWRDWTNVLLDAAINPGDNAQLPLLEFLRSRPWPMSIFRRSLEALRLAGRLETERDAVAIAAGAFPASAWVQARQAEVAAQIAARAAVAVAPSVADKPRWTEKTFLDRLDELLRGAKWDEAEALLRDVRDQQPLPAWLDKRDDRVRLAQVRIAQARGATADMLAAVRTYLNGDAERSKTILDLARGYYASGDQASALALAKEVQRRSPEYTPARRPIAEWTPKPKN